MFPLRQLYCCHMHGHAQWLNVGNEQQLSFCKCSVMPHGSSVEFVDPGEVVFSAQHSAHLLARLAAIEPLRPAR